MIIKVTSLEEKLHSESYWISRKNIDFSNSKGFSFTIPENSVFDIASRYIQGLKIYEISIRYYKFSNEFTINGTPDMTDSPVAVFSRAEYRLDEKSLEEFINTLNLSAENMNKAVFESKLYEHQDIRNYIHDVKEINKKTSEIHYESEKDNETSDKNNTISIYDKVYFYDSAVDLFDKMINWAANIETHYVLNLIISGFNILAGFLSLLYFVFRCMTDLSSDDSLFMFKTVLSVICAAFFFINFFMKPSGSLEFYKNIFTPPLKIIDFFNLADTQYSTHAPTKPADILHDETEKKKFIEASALAANLRKISINLENNFLIICSDIFASNKISTSADIRETETRTEEELRGNYARVVFPVYEKKKKVSLVKKSDVQNNYDDNNPLLHRVPVNLSKEQNSCHSEVSHSERTTIKLTK